MAERVEPSEGDSETAWPRATFTVLALATGTYSIAQTMIVPALPDISRQLHVDQGAAAWTLTAYLISSGLFTPLFGRLGDMFGKRRVLVVSLVGFVVGGVIGAIGGNLGVVVAGRAVQGVGGGILPLSFGLVRDEFAADVRASAIGLVSAICGVGSAFGLLLGGVILQFSDYHWILGAGAAAAAIAVVGCARVPESSITHPARVDLVGMVLLGLGLTAPLLAISEGDTWGWADGRTVGLFAAGAALLALFCQVESRRGEPLIDVRTLRSPDVLLTNVVTFLLGIGIFASFILTSELVQAPRSTGYGFGAGAIEVGLVLAPGAIAMLVGGMIAGRVGPRVGHRSVMALACVIAAAGLIGLAFWRPSEGPLIVWLLVLNFGVGLAFAAVPNVIVGLVPASQTGQATGVNNVFRSIGSSVGAQVSGALLVATVAAGRTEPTDAGFVRAFLACGVLTALGGVLGYAVRTGAVRTGAALPPVTYAGSGASLVAERSDS